MGLLTEIGVVAPRIVTKVVCARNYLEHEYRTPDKEQLEAAVDVAIRFVATLERSLAFFPESFSFDNLAEGLELVPGGVAGMQGDLFSFSLRSALVRNTRLRIRHRQGKEEAHSSFSRKLDFEGIRPR